MILPMALTVTAGTIHAQEKKMNILFIAVDDMNNDLVHKTSLELDVINYTPDRGFGVSNGLFFRQ